MTNNQTKTRITQIDTLKGFLILSVCLSNTLHILPASNLNAYACSVLYLFNIQLFIFFSGMFSPRFSPKRLGIIFGSFILYGLLSNYPSLTLIPQMFLNPPANLWYLECLIFWKIMIIPLYPLLARHPKKILFAAAIVSLLCGYLPLPLEIGNISRTLVYFPLFILGRICTWPQVKNFADKISLHRLLWALLPVGYILILANIAYSDLYVVFYNKFNYFHTQWPDFAILLRLFQFTAAGIISLLLIKTLPAGNRFLNLTGRHSLAVYLSWSYLLFLLN